MHAIMLIGVPGSGKSTWVKKYLNLYGRSRYVVLSSDNYIENVAATKGKTYSEVFSEYVKDAEAAMESDLNYAIKAGKDVIWDQTNLTARTRAKKLAKLEGFNTMAVYFDIPFDLEARLASRPGKVIPKPVMETMLKSIEYPSYEEGFELIMENSTKP